VGAARHPGERGGTDIRPHRADRVETLEDGARAHELRRRIPLGRFGEPWDVVGAVAFLLGDAAAMVAGHTLVVDGGYTIH